MSDRDTHAVRCRGLQKTYGVGAASVTALNGVDIDVRRGEMLMLAGPSGCGKSTFLSVISTLLDADAGRCTVLGEDISQLAPADKVAFRGRALGFVFQDFNLLPALTARENVAVPLLIQGVRRQRALRQAADALAEVGLDSKEQSRPGQMSGGQQQRVAIARALVASPQLIVCDEPTSSLDHNTGQMIVRLLKDIVRNTGSTILIVTHDNRIYHFADRIAQMEDGKILRIDSEAGVVP